MRTSASVQVPATAADVFPIVADLATYPSWIGMVHTASSDEPSETGRAAWVVELRARVGPFARSKQLRMERIGSVPDRLVQFERAEVDGREHARWSLRAEVAPCAEAASEVTMHLAYDGHLWTGGLLERVLEAEIRRGADGLVRLLRNEPTR